MAGKKEEDGKSLPTSEEQLDAIGTGPFNYYTIFTLILFNVAYGMEILATNICYRALPRTKWGMQAEDRPRVVAIAYFGFMVGAFVSGHLADKFGRKPIMVLHSVFFTPFSIWSAMSFDLATLYVTQCVVGISIGVMLPVAVSLITELAIPSRRGGMILAVPGLGFITGEILVLIVGLIAMRDNIECEDDCGWWRWVFVAGTVPNLVAMFILVFHIPESPRYLLLVGETEEAERSIRKIAIANGAEDRLLQGGRLAPLHLDTRNTSALELLQPPICWDFFAIAIAWTLFGLGIYGTNFLTPILLENVYHYNAAWQFSTLLLFVSVQGLSCIFFIWIADWPNLGRLFLVLCSCLVAVPMLGSAGLAMGQPLYVVGPLVLGGMCTANAAYQCFYIYAAERMPTSHRALGIGAANGLSKSSAVAGPILLSMLIAQELYGASLLLLAGSVALGATVMVGSSTKSVSGKGAEEGAAGASGATLEGNTIGNKLGEPRGSTETVGKALADRPEREDEVPSERTRLLDE